MDSADLRLGILKNEAAVFKQYLSDLPEASWNQPSACARWTVADVVSHIGSQPFALSITRGLQGIISPPEGRPTVEEHDEDEFAEGIAQRAFATRKQIGEQLLPWFIGKIDESVQVFDKVGSDQWETECYWPPGPEPVRVLLDMRIAELTMHAWDVCSRLEPDYHLSAGSIGALIDTVPRAVRRAFRADPSLFAPIRYRFLVATPYSVDVDILIARDGTQISPATAEPADVTFQCDGETYVLVMYGRLSPDEAMVSGRLIFEGNAGLAAGFGQKFKGG